MASWTDGYVAEIGYTHGFYRELAPAMLAFAALAAGDQSAIRTSPLSYCELGCGQGFTANLLASANPDAEFYAIDFNPAQIVGARQLAADAELSNVHFYDLSFAEIGTDASLPQSFDIIALHGIYSWINAENRRHIVEFIRRRLKPGGQVYISYNTLPGWASVMPLRRLMADHAARNSGPVLKRIDQALDFTQTLQAAGAAYFSQNPILASRLEKLKDMQRRYLAHEYFNADWTPFYFKDVASELAEAKLGFLCSAHLLDQINAANLTADQQTLLASINDLVTQQGMRDYIVNQQFRRDVFVKGALALSERDLRTLWLQQKFVLSTRRQDIPLKAVGALGEADLQAEVYEPVLDTLASGPVSVEEMINTKGVANLDWSRLTQAIVVLVGTGHLQPCLAEAHTAAAASHTEAFNTAVLAKASISADLQYLASPVTGGGIAVDRISQLFLAAMARNAEDPVHHAWEVLSGQGQSLIKDGQVLQGMDANVAELRVRLEDFQSRRLPVLKQLGAVPGNR